ncbi:MAG: hypothetical protein AAFP26_06375 [Planctomycetota bacterium]
MRLGDLLVKKGALTPEQRDAVLEAQAGSSRPFGAIAEGMFGVHPRAVEEAWGEQYAEFAGEADPRTTDISGEVLALIDKRQAWQFAVIPMELSDDGELLVVTSPRHLARAMRFTGWRLDRPSRFAICTNDALVLGLGKHYPMDAVDPGAITQLMGHLIDAA